MSTEPAFRKKKETSSLSAAPPAKRPPVQRQKRATVNGVADLSPPAFAGDGPTRSATQSTGAKERSAMRNVALDLAVRKIAFCEVAGGQVLRRLTVSSIKSLEPHLGRQAQPAKVAIESCREAWHMHDILSAWGNQVLLVDTTRVRQLGVGQHGRKTDRIDAEVLARAVERGGIPAAHLLSPPRRQLRLELSIRRALVETRSQYVTTVRGLARARGQLIRRCATTVFVTVVRKTNLDGETLLLVEPLLEAIELLNRKVADVEARLENLAQSEPVIGLLATVPGIGVLIASAFVSVIDDAGRFSNGHQVSAYLGLVPREDTSGGSDKQRLGHITKHGNTYLRWLLVQAAWSLLRSQRSKHDSLAEWGHRVAKRRGTRIATVALARRLCGVLWAMWRDGTPYNARPGPACWPALHTTQARANQPASP
jgi:transposase